MIERPIGADADRPRRDRLVRARDGIPLRAAAGEGITAVAQHADRPGVLCAEGRCDVPRLHVDEIAALKQSAEQFAIEKAGTKCRAPYGMPYSPQYLKQSRGTKK